MTTVVKSAARPAPANRTIASGSPAKPKMRGGEQQAEREAAVVDRLGGEGEGAPAAGLGPGKAERDRQRADQHAGHERRGVEPHEEGHGDQGAAGHRQQGGAQRVGDEVV